ncbi:MAG TPA: hypothetical protein VG796_08335 [Verrucomicrobiales bacterium]|nr:hypothetical protein [Verrucomicrobiales bacterium]
MNRSPFHGDLTGWYCLTLSTILTGSAESAGQTSPGRSDEGAQPQVRPPPTGDESAESA